MHCTEAFLPSPLPFLAQLFEEIAAAGLDFSHLPIDHICYRCNTPERYAELCQKMQNCGTLLSEQSINGRPIATFRLGLPYDFRGQKIELLEIPSPKMGSDYAEGFEHIEMVIKERFADFINRYSAVDFDQKAAHKPVNPEIRLHFPSGAVKFHHYPLDYVIAFLD